jgi:hypothetical protein
LINRHRVWLRQSDQLAKTEPQICPTSRLPQESTNRHLQVQASKRMQNYLTIETTPNLLPQVNFMNGLPNERGVNVTG